MRRILSSRCSSPLPSHRRSSRVGAAPAPNDSDVPLLRGLMLPILRPEMGMLLLLIQVLEALSISRLHGKCHRQGTAATQRRAFRAEKRTFENQQDPFRAGQNRQGRRPGPYSRPPNNSAPLAGSVLAMGGVGNRPALPTTE